MSILEAARVMLSRAFATLNRRRMDEDFRKELASHLELMIEQNMKRGMTYNEARRRARLRLGGVDQLRETNSELRGFLFFEDMARDFVYAFRVLRRSPSFVLAAVSTLALAIGANAVVFSVMNAFVLRPLNVPDAQSLFELQRGDEASGFESYPNYVDLRDRNHTFDSVIAWNILSAGLDTGQNPTREWIVEASGNYFDGLGLKPYLGHFFHAADEHGFNSAPYVVLSYAFWHTHFQGDRSVIGRGVQLDRHPFTVIGVAPPGFHGTLLFFNPDIFVPLVNHPQLSPDDMNDRANRFIFMTMGHVKKGVSHAQAIADLNSIGAELQRSYPKQVGKMNFSLASPSLYGDYLGKPARAFFTGLTLLAALILLAACANLGSLFSARASDRAREIALRLALGSNRRRILRALFTEAVLVSLLGGAIGLCGSVILLRAMSAWQPFPRWPMHVPVNPDGRVYLLALLLTLASGFLFGAVPVKQILRTNPYEVVKAGSSARAGARLSVRDVLLVAQIAICAVLVTASMVAVRGLARSIHTNYGFRVEDTLLVDTDLSMAGYSTDRVPAMQRRMIETLETIPGVESVGLSDNVQLGDGSSDTTVYTDATTDLKPANAAGHPYVYNISPGFFHAAGVVLLAGRDFTWGDDKDAPRVALVNPEFARRLFGTASNAVGRYFKLRDGTRAQVVGMVEQGKYERLTEDPHPTIFLPILQSPSTATWLVAHITRDPVAVGPAIRGRFHELDPGLPIFVQPRIEEMAPALFGPRIATAALGVLGFMGAMLAITGVFGMATYAVSKRLRELGIRIALGAQRKEVLLSALGRAFRLLAIGSVAGLLLGLLASRVLALVVYQATPRDPLVLGGVVAAMALLGLLATWLPAQRALSVNPLILLRDQ
jgi:predicted permease